MYDRAMRSVSVNPVRSEAEGLMNDEESRRREFPICARKIYLAHAADAPLPRRVAEAMHASVDNASKNEKLFDESLTLIAETRSAIANFIGANPEQISLTGPTSSGLNIVANGIDWKAGDEVVCYLDEYPANVYPWLALQRRGVSVVFLQPERVGEITPEIVERALTPRTRMVALASANYCSGYRIDLDAIGSLCHKRGALFCVDGIQTLGAFSISLRYVDFLSAGAQKWLLGPSGAGILFVKNGDLLWPNVIGGWNVRSPNFIAQPEIEFAAGGQKFEPGGYSYVAIAGLRAAVALLDEVGNEKISARILALTGALRDGIRDFEFLSPNNLARRSGILTFRHPRIATEALAQKLTENDVVASLRHDRRGRAWLRISPHFYNTEAEIEQVAALLSKWGAGFQPVGKAGVAPAI
jgi:cysteine desulfurase / selenocysteine lyase